MPSSRDLPDPGVKPMSLMSLALTGGFFANVCVSCSIVSNSVSPWTVPHQAPLSMEFSRQEYWSESPSLFPGDLPNPAIEPRSPAMQAESLPSEPPKVHLYH